MNEKIAVFDLHCDTVLACLKQGAELKRNHLQLDLERGLETAERWIQTLAFFIDDCYRGEDAWNHFGDQYRLMRRFLEENSEAIRLWRPTSFPTDPCCQAMLSVEGGAVLGGKLERIGELYRLGVAMMTLVWNGENELGSGIDGCGEGLTAFGKNAVREMEQNGMVVDVSHLNDAGFYDVERLAKKPFVATHSNARALCAHPRNLTDEQIRCIIDRRGLIGLNFYPLFVNGGQEYAIDELIRHAEHILSLGGERILALGSDFDGADMPAAIPDIKGLENLYQSMIKYFGTEITKDVFFGNAAEFFRRVTRRKGKKENVV